MSELAKAYEPQQIADRLYAEWLARDLYHAQPESERGKKNGYFSIVIPPPNVTGMLTLGHVLNNTIQDILCRQARMQGKEVLWLPGTDHAGLSTQTAVEKWLRKNENKTRHDLGRDEFLRRTWEWKEKFGGIIIHQLKKLGASCDWKRERFTMDEAYSKAVQKVFVDLYNKGCIYRAKRMVNWCPGSLTAISDEEVIPKEQKSTLFYMKYEVAEEPGRFLEIATTRPETLMGDTAVAVHPEDERYQALIGKHCWRPFPREKIPIVGDSHIDPKFGTGVLKVTPAHDKADFEIGQRHKLPAIDVLHPNGKINCPKVPELDGLDRFEARKKAADMLREQGLLPKEEPYTNNVGFSERADVPVEPRLSDQWFLDYRKMLGGKMIEEALRVVNEKLIEFFPAHWTKTYNHWLENIQPWCISRQVWWGHRIPVWYGKGDVRCQVESPGPGWEQDPDTLDTWFSSWLWAYETMDETARKKFYPTSVLVTGPDIIFLWVARMIIAGLEFKPGASPKTEDNIAFQHVYFTGLIRDKQGRKMSKSLGNSPDPLDLIAQYGADGLRFGLMRMAPQGQDIRFDEKQIEEGRNFCNKLWNACRFRQMQGPIDPAAKPENHPLSIFAAHILDRLATTLTAYNLALARYEFNTAANVLYGFVWDDLCSRFLEAAKADFQDAASETRAGTLATFDSVLSVVLRLLHPYAPFVTEELWIQLGFAKETIQFAAWPEGTPPLSNHAAIMRAAALYQAVDAGRNLRGEFNIPSSQKIKYQLLTRDLVTPNERTVLAGLLNASEVELITDAPAKTPVALTPIGELYLPLAGLIDPEVEKKRLEKELQKVEKDVQLTQAKLSNTAMLEKAPAEKVAEWKGLAVSLQEKQTKLKAQLAAL
jgi:valyl-tRNA synthetase